MQELPMEAVERLSRVTKLLRTQRTLPAKLEAIVAIATRMIRHCDAAGISLLIDGQPTSTAVSDRLAVEIDLIQYETGEGPCLSAIRDSKMVRVDVIGQDSRFSRFTPGALDRDVNAFLSIPLRTSGPHRRRHEPLLPYAQRLRRRSREDGAASS